MDHSLNHPSYTLFTPSSPMSRPTKVVQQRQYREKESELFNILRTVIYDLTEEQMQTRQEILRKAIDLLSIALETKRLEDATVVHPVGTSSLTEHHDVVSTHLGSSAQPHWPQRLQVPAEFDTQTTYYASPAHVQQYHLMPDMSFTLSLPNEGSRGYEVWSHHV